MSPDSSDPGSSRGRSGDPSSPLPPFEASDSRASSARLAASGLALAAVTAWAAAASVPALGAAAMVWIPAVVFWLLVGARGVQGLVDRTPRLRITPEGVYDRTSWLSPGFVRWEEITDVRPGTWGAEVELADASRTLSRLGWPRRGLAHVGRWLARFDLLVATGGLDVPRRVAADALQEAFERHQLEGLRRAKALASGDPAGSAPAAADTRRGDPPPTSPAPP